MFATCLVCGQSYPVELMELESGGRYRCVCCEIDANRAAARVARRRILAAAGPMLGMFAVGAGLPSVVVLRAGQVSPHTLGGLGVLALPVAALALAAAATALPGIVSTGRSLARVPDLPVLDRILVPLSAIAALGLAAVGLIIAAALVAGPTWWPL